MIEVDKPQEMLISLTMRTTGGRQRETRRALASVAAGLYRPVEVIVVYQGDDEDELAFLASLQGSFGDLSVRILQNPAKGDRRAQNLNLGLAASRGRYVGFLDDDDTLAPRHGALLVDTLRKTGRAWAYAQTVLRKEDETFEVVSESRPFVRHRFSLRDLWTENFIPIHSFLIDRERLHPELRQQPFLEDLDRSEDWDYLIRLAYFHEPAVVDEFTCFYHVSTGARNTNISLMSGDEARRQELNRQAWARCKTIVEQRKAALAERVWWARPLLAGIPGVPDTVVTPAATAPGGQTAAASREPADLHATLDRPATLATSRRIARALIRWLERCA